MLKKTIGFLFLIGLLTGCGSNQLNDNATTNDGNDKMRKISSNPTDQNPNMIDLRQKDPAITVGTDVDKAKYVVKRYKNYYDPTVWVNGNNMWVTAHTGNRLTAKERMKEEAKIHKKLIQALPRYDINVKIEEK
ncbi:hypothetical protein [Heyndrickxia vini]|uniref:Sporulation protein n=1 Tax=Heyndrickxia vini TaxID=1476025 RepID=A0ABX7E117_9BACI|nr:hypothetical protein [Heyndrickxia vini]QQZ09227.1 hypothetical protein I5776_20040 [Heyndrickxia vini]